MAAVHRFLLLNYTHSLEGRYCWHYSHNANRSTMLPIVVSSIELCQVIQFLLNVLMHLKGYSAGLWQKQEAPSEAWWGAKWQHQKPSLDLERWPSGQYCILLLQRTWVRFLASTPGGSQYFSWDITDSYALSGNLLSHVLMPTVTSTQS